MISVFIKSESRYPFDKQVIQANTEEFLRAQGVVEPAMVSIMVVGSRKIRSLNHHYRGIDASTDVLSFPTLDPSQPIEQHGFSHGDEIGRILGDIVVCYPEAVMLATRKNAGVEDAIWDLVQHGLLHLLGFHHD